MKLFVLGIDGAMKDAFMHFEMPFIQSCINNGNEHMFEEDLLTRGWAKIYSGKLANEVGSFYEYLLCDGTYKWSEKFSSEKLKEDGVQTIWEYLNNEGYTVGLMNIPTASPVSPVNGFWIGGGGGGDRLTNQIEEKDVYPKHEAEFLNKIGYIKDERFESLITKQKLFDRNQFFDRLIYMTKKRVDAYLELSKQYNQDFGFLVMRSLAVVNYIFASEIAAIVTGKKTPQSKGDKELALFFKSFDKQLERLFDGLNPDHFIMVADHGMTVLNKELNINQLLIDLGYQVTVNTKKNINQLVLKYRDFIPPAIKKFLKKRKSLSHHYVDVVTFNTKLTKAFSFSKMGTMHGIYINDAKRFQGEIAPKKVGNLAAEISSAINNHHLMIQNNIIATPCNTSKNGKYGYLMPDILLTMPSEIKPVSTGDFLLQNIFFNDKEIKLTKVKNAHLSGVKCKKTLMIYSDSTISNGSDLLGTDLRSVYNMIKYVFGNKK